MSGSSSSNSSHTVPSSSPCNFSSGSSGSAPFPCVSSSSHSRSSRSPILFPSTSVSPSSVVSYSPPSPVLFPDYSSLYSSYPQSSVPNPLNSSSASFYSALEGGIVTVSPSPSLFRSSSPILSVQRSSLPLRANRLRPVCVVKPYSGRCGSSTVVPRLPQSLGRIAAALDSAVLPVLASFVSSAVNSSSHPVSPGSSPHPSSHSSNPTSSNPSSSSVSGHILFPDTESESTSPPPSPALSVSSSDSERGLPSRAFLQLQVDRLRAKLEKFRNDNNPVTAHSDGDSDDDSIDF